MNEVVQEKLDNKDAIIGVDTNGFVGNKGKRHEKIYRGYVNNYIIILTIVLEIKMKVEKNSIFCSIV